MPHNFTIFAKRFLAMRTLEYCEPEKLGREWLTRTDLNDTFCGLYICRHSSVDIKGLATPFVGTKQNSLCLLLYQKYARWKACTST